MEPPRSRSVSILTSPGISCPEALLRSAMLAAMDAHGLIGEVNLLLTDDDVVQGLNRQFRGVDLKTDVLTFSHEPMPGEPEPILGEVAISVPYAGRQAALRGVSIDHELAYLAIHGVLHLAGFDDIRDEDRRGMQLEMSRIAVTVGLPADENWSSMLHAEESGAAHA